MAGINKQELIEFFLIESEENFETILNSLVVLEQSPDNWSLIDEMFRSAHTIKGSAAMVGFVNTSALGHKLEDFLDMLRTGNVKITESLTANMLVIFEEFNNIIKSTKSDLSSEAYQELLKKVDIILNEQISLGAKKDKSGLEETGIDFKEKEDAEIPLSREYILDKADTNFAKIGDYSGDSFVRVKLEKLDTLLGLVGELVTNKNRQLDRVKTISNLSQELEYTKNRLMDLIREFEEKFYYTISSDDALSTTYSEELLGDFSEGEFDRYDHFNILSRRLQEIGNDIVMVIKSIFHQFNFFGEEISYINRVTDGIQKGLTSMRLVPLDRLFNASIRAAKTAANVESKKVRVSISGEKIELDKTVIDLLTEAFMHLVRNAVSHGIENESERTAKGKAPEGNITLRAKREGSQIVLEVEDDGKGINPEAIKRKLLQKGLISEYELNNLRGDKLFEYLFKPGFSTLDEASELSGRGVGLDIVKNRVESIGGTISIINRENKGVTFVVVIPTSMLIADYLLMEENSQVFSVPVVSVYESFNIASSNIKKIGEHFFYAIRDKIYEIHDLGLLLKQVDEAEFKNGDVGILVEGVQKPYIITVDRIVGRETSVTKKIGKILEGLRHFVGATVSPKGEPRLILDPIRLIETKTGVTLRYSRKETEEKLKDVITYLPNSILVVDDSISIRKFLTSSLSNQGYIIDEATDGANALLKLDNRKYDLIITDLEMPVMNGYELIEKIRNYKQDNITPIFVLTSRATEKHKAKAFELGANDFLIKPLNEDRIREKVREVMLERA